MIWGLNDHILSFEHNTSVQDTQSLNLCPCHPYGEKTWSYYSGVDPSKCTDLRWVYRLPILSTLTSQVKVLTKNTGIDREPEHINFDPYLTLTVGLEDKHQIGVPNPKRVGPLWPREDSTSSDFFSLVFSLTAKSGPEFSMCRNEKKHKRISFFNFQEGLSSSLWGQGCRVTLLSTSWDSSIKYW